MSWNLQEEVHSLQDGTYSIDHELEGSSLDSAIDEAIDALAGSPEAIGHAVTFDTFRSSLKHANRLSPSQLSKILDTLCSAFQSELDATARDGLDLQDVASYRSHRHTLELYAFLLLWFVQAAEAYTVTNRSSGDGAEASATAKKKGGRGKTAATSKGKGKAKDVSEFDWPGSIPALLVLFAKALRVKTDRIWQTTSERDAFVNCFVKPANRIAESETYMKAIDIRLQVYKIFCIAAKNQGQGYGLQIIVLQNLTAYDHLAEPMAELAACLAKEFDYSQLGEEVLRDIAARQFTSGSDVKTQKQFPRFLVRLSELNPRMVHKQMILLQRHLDSESHSMRMALIEVIGNLLREVIATEDSGEPGQKEREMDNFFGLLFERFLDLNSFVRSKVVATAMKLLETKEARLVKYRLRLAALASRSLEDKTSTVRKNCISLLTKLIVTHAHGDLHGGELDREVFQTGYDMVCAELEPMEAPSQDVLDAMADDKASGDEADKENDQPDASTSGAKTKVKTEEHSDDSGLDDSDSDSPDDDETREERKRKASHAKAERKKRKQSGAAGRRSTMAIEQAFAQLDQDKLAKLRLTKRYYSDALVFINEIEKAIPNVEKLLASKAKSEVLESIEFFKIATEYKIANADTGVKRMLHLVWAKDNSTVEDGQEVKGVRSRLIECYRSLYFDPLKGLSPVQNINRITQNLVTLTYGATLAELTSLEQLMSILMADRDTAIHDDVISRLWQVYSSHKDIPKEQRRGAIIVLGMLATAKPQIVSDHLDLLLRVGLGDLGKSDYVLARYTCLALRRIGGTQKKVKGALQDHAVRLPMDNLIFARLMEAVENPTVDQEWFSMAEQAIDTIYALGEQPDGLCSSIIQHMTIRLFGRQALQHSKEEETEMDMQETLQTQTIRDTTFEPEASQMPESTPQPKQGEQQTDTANAFELAQLLFAAGHVSVKQLLHLELLEREFKRRKAETEKKDTTKTAEREELDNVVGSVEDDIADVVAASKEKELLYGPQSLLAIFGPMSVAICSQPRLYKNRTLRVAAVSAMSKFMCVSAQFCEDHLMLLFKLLETASDPVIRSNIVIALGDIAVCFSTLMDQNSDRLYAGLTDRDLTVKKNTLMVLTHLILNGMIKVKGQLGEMAKCLQDEESRISDFAKLFFEELASKENAIYNNLPDIISHLSVGHHAVDEEAYQAIMKYIFRYIEKEKQAESIIEKLCQRFRLVTDERQWRDIAFCMSLLPFKSERSVKKLVEGLPFYQDKLREEVVYRYFVEILNKARTNKATKNEADLLEFEKALEEHKRTGQENAAIEQKAQRKTRKKATVAARGRGKGRTQAVATPPSSPER